MATDLTVKKYTELEKQKRELESMLEAVNREMAELEPAVVEYFQDNGVSQMKYKDLGLTVFLKRTVRAQIVPDSREEIADILKRSGYEYMVKEDFNLNSLHSLVREFDEREEAIPVDLAQYVQPVQIFTASFRKS